MMAALLPGAIGADMSFCNRVLPQLGQAGTVEGITSNSKLCLHFVQV
jgi:hypothetical protein